MIRGSVDVLTTNGASGWIYTDTQKEPLSVEAVINHQVIGNAIASLSRPDLAAAGFGSGNCGFELQFGNQIDPLFLPFVRIRMAGTDLELSRWAGAGFGDYFRALHERYPRAGRAASVYGGLWTDRTDAAAILKGRLDTGVIPPSEANGIARFVHEGVIVAGVGEEKKQSKPNGGAISDVPTAVAAAVFDDRILRMLRAILDDNPVAVRADVLDSDETAFAQVSALEDLPSPAECLGLTIPYGSSSAVVEIVRGGHRLPEFMQNGISRWTHDSAGLLERFALSPNMAVDRHEIPAGNVLVASPGAICRTRASLGKAIKLLVLPSRLSLLRFQKQAPRGELAHGSGARIWV